MAQQTNALVFADPQGPGSVPPATGQVNCLYLVLTFLAFNARSKGKKCEPISSL